MGGRLDILNPPQGGSGVPNKRSINLTKEDRDFLEEFSEMEEGRIGYREIIRVLRILCSLILKRRSQWQY